jgi:LysM repeat protein
VKPGDTLESIAKKMGVSVDKLAEWNNISDKNFLMVGQPLKVKF